MKTALASSNPNTREFYFFGHGGRDGNSIGYRDSTPNDGLTVEDVSILLQNFSEPPRNGKPMRAVFHKPFDFVFLDGCMTGKGDFPNAFGIPRTIPSPIYDAFNSIKKRAFLGWTNQVTASILDSDHLNWTKTFWDKWLTDNPHTVTVKEARDAADGAYPSAASTGMILVGSENLTWNGD